jgi:hypothetical protein
MFLVVHRGPVLVTGASQLRSLNSWSYLVVAVAAATIAVELVLLPE